MIETFSFQESPENICKDSTKKDILKIIRQFKRPLTTL